MAKKKYRRIKYIFEEGLFCEECDEMMIPEQSSVTLLTDQPPQLMLKCPKCGKLEPLNQDMMPQQNVITSDWADGDLSDMTKVNREL